MIQEFALEMIEKLTLKREHPPEWLLGSVPVNNPHLVTLHGEAGQGVAVPLALLVAGAPSPGLGVVDVRGSPSASVAALS